MTTITLKRIKELSEITDALRPILDAGNIYTDHTEVVGKYKQIGNFGGYFANVVWVYTISFSDDMYVVRANRNVATANGNHVERYAIMDENLLHLLIQLDDKIRKMDKGEMRL